MKLPKIDMKAIKAATKTTYNTAKILGKKYAPVVLVTTGLVGYGVAVYQGIKSGKKLEATKAKYEAKDAAGEEYTHMEVIKDVTKDVAVPVAIAVASTAAIGLGFAIQTNRLKAVSAALTAVTEEHARYRLQCKEVLDEETFKKIDTPMEQVTIEEDGKEAQSFVPKEGLMYGNWFKYSANYASDSPEYNEQWIRESIRVLEEKIARKGVLNFSDMLDQLGFDVPKAALPFGWTDTDGFYIEYDIMEVWNAEEQMHEPQIYVRWKCPRNLYATTNFRDLIPGRKELA